MNTHEFFQALEEMQKAATILRRAMRYYFPACEDALRGRHLEIVTKEKAAGSCLEMVRCQLDELLAQYDRARLALGQPLRYFIYFDYWRSPYGVEREMRWARYKADPRR